MDKQLQERVDDFTDTLMKVIGTSLPGETMRTVVEALAMRFATQVQQETTTIAAKPSIETEQEDKGALEAAGRVWEKVEEEIASGEEPVSAAWREAVETAQPETTTAPLGTPWGEDAQKPKAALTAQDKDPT